MFSVSFFMFLLDPSVYHLVRIKGCFVLPQHHKRLGCHVGPAFFETSGSGLLMGLRGADTEDATAWKKQPVPLSLRKSVWSSLSLSFAFCIVNLSLFWVSKVSRTWSNDNAEESLIVFLSVESVCSAWFSRALSILSASSPSSQSCQTQPLMICAGFQLNRSHLQVIYQAIRDRY